MYVGCTVIKDLRTTYSIVLVWAMTTSHMYVLHGYCINIKVRSWVSPGMIPGCLLLGNLRLGEPLTRAHTIHKVKKCTGYHLLSLIDDCREIHTTKGWCEGYHYHPLDCISTGSYHVMRMLTYVRAQHRLVVINTNSH